MRFPRFAKLLALPLLVTLLLSMLSPVAVFAHDAGILTAHTTIAQDDHGDETDDHGDDEDDHATDDHADDDAGHGDDADHDEDGDDHGDDDGHGDDAGHGDDGHGDDGAVATTTEGNIGLGVTLGIIFLVLAMIAIVAVIGGVSLGVIGLGYWQSEAGD